MTPSQNPISASLPSAHLCLVYTSAWYITSFGIYHRLVYTIVWYIRLFGICQCSVWIDKMPFCRRRSVTSACCCVGWSRRWLIVHDRCKVVEHETPLLVGVCSAPSKMMTMSPRADLWKTSSCSPSNPNRAASLMVGPKLL